MPTNDVENALRNLKFVHLTEDEITAYNDHQLDAVRLATANAHLSQCFICERLLLTVREEHAASADREVTVEDIALVDRLMEQSRPGLKKSGASAPDATTGIPVLEWLAGSLRQMTAQWQLDFKPVRRVAEAGEEVWAWQSNDGRLRARATIEKNADMIVHFYSNEMALEGARLRFRLDSLIAEITLERISEAEVAANVAVPWEYRRGDMTDISIEII